MTEHIEKCTCGNDITDELQYIDSVYPCNRERTKWNVCCQWHNGGCGRTVYGDTVEQAISRWNEGDYDECIQ